jgi:hypothetical protein
MKGSNDHTASKIYFKKIFINNKQHHLRQVKFYANYYMKRVTIIINQVNNHKSIIIFQRFIFLMCFSEKKVKKYTIVYEVKDDINY